MQEYYMAEAPEEGYPVSSIYDAPPPEAEARVDREAQNQFAFHFLSSTNPPDPDHKTMTAGTFNHLTSQGSVYGTMVVRPRRRRQLSDLPNEILTLIAKHVVRNVNVNNRNGKWRLSRSSKNVRFINPLSYRLINKLFDNLVQQAFMDESAFHIEDMEGSARDPKLKYLTWCRGRLNQNAPDVQQWILRRPGAHIEDDYAYMDHWTMSELRTLMESQRLVYEPNGQLTIAVHRLEHRFVPRRLFEKVVTIGLSRDRLVREVKRALTFKEMEKRSTASAGRPVDAQQASRISHTDLFAAFASALQCPRESPFNVLPRLSKLLLELPPYDWPPMDLITSESRAMRAFLEMLPNVKELTIVRGWHVFSRKSKVKTALAHYNPDTLRTLGDLDARFEAAVQAMIEQVQDERAKERMELEIERLNESDAEEEGEDTKKITGKGFTC